MALHRFALLAGLLAALPTCAWSAQAATPLAAGVRSAETQVDALFDKWNKPGVPGAVIEVIRDGKVVLRKAYGMADIERGVPLTPDSVLNIGSVTKQFTAFSIHLLAQEGKLSLGDDVHKYLPELPDFGKPILLRHLLQHTSGLRDPYNLMVLGGWRLDDIVTDDDTHAIIQRQRSLNFVPGDEYLYSNAGYNLLAEIVQRASGKPLARFARERIFEPLGMKHTSFQQDYRTLTPGRALSYQAAPEGAYWNTPDNHASVGPGSLLSTLEDLALWDRNFFDAKVGGKALLAQMHLTNPLNNGKPNNYASGLFIENYHGRKLVEHSGGTAGYRSVLARYPEHGLSVIVLANTSDLNAVTLGRRIADIYLDGAVSGAPDAPAAVRPQEAAADPAQFDGLVGYYAMSPHEGIDIMKQDGMLMGRVSGQQAFRLYPAGGREYFLKVAAARISFGAPAANGLASGVVLHQDGKDIPAARAAVPLPPRVEDYTGEFYSDELHVLYTVALQGGRLSLTHPRGTIPLDYTENGEFVAPFPVAQIKYQCTPQAGCSGFTVTNGRVRNLQFTKVAIVGAGARQTAASGVFLKPAPATLAAAGVPGS